MAWTEMQKQAIYKRNQNIIVSAGAGSGKTAVLSERILSYCLEGKDICSFLVLTFTNAAAMEMKERIRKKLNANGLKNQAARIDQAFITTFDAYSLALVKKYYFHLGLEKNLSIIDQALLEVQKKNILEQMFQERYDSSDLRFLNLLTKYTKQNDENVKKMILVLLSKLELLVDEEVFIKEYKSTYESDAFISGLLKKYEKLALEKIADFKTELIRLQELASVDTPSQKLYEEVTRMVDTMQIASYDEAANWLSTVTLPRINPKSLPIVKSQKEKCTQELKEVREGYFAKYLFLADAKSELIAIQQDVEYLLELVWELKNRLDSYKHKIMAFDYMDIAKMAIRLVQTEPMVLKEIQEGFTEILIDEYQDTSDIQEAFIQCISRNNCYMVGDIKQSIYRFRNANPYIFKEKYQKFSEGKNGVKIDLTHNFRSRKEVIEDINLIFSNWMTLEFGDANYALEHMMRYGQEEYNKDSQQNQYHMEILGYDVEEGFTEEEMEAFICGNKIKQLMQEQPLCLKDNQFQPIQYSDIAILMDKTKSFVTFKRVFEYLGIPVAIEADLDLVDSILPKLFSNILIALIQWKKQCLDKTYAHAMASIGRSFLFSLSDTELYEMLRLGKKNELTDLIERLSESVDQISLEELYFTIVEEFQVYAKLPLIGEVSQSAIVLDYVYSLFKTMESTAMDIYEASQYFASIFDAGIALKYKLSEDSKNCVHMMTIHKSKGLEFPYCFFPMLGSRFNQSDIKENFGLTKEYGIYIPFSDETNSNTIIKTLVQEDLRQADLSEKIRLFYVALTRAREKMFLISRTLDVEEPIAMKKVSSFNQMLYTKLFLDEYRTEVKNEDLALSLKYRMTKRKNIDVTGQTITYDLDDYQPEYLDQQRISKELVELADPSLNQAIELGKKFHACLEVLDFTNIQIDELPVDDFMKNVLKKIIKTPVFQDIQNARTYHEHEFYFDNYHGIIDLLCIYKDHIDIIDYKLANTSSEAYLRQLGIYKEYVSRHTNLPISCYLLSILKQEIKKVL